MAALRLAALCSLAPLAAGLTSRKAAANEDYYWPHARGHPGQYSITPHTGPSNLTAALSWSWHHPEGTYHTVVVSAPLIDHRKNIYISSEDGIRKFSQTGETLWHYKSRGSISTCPSLMDGALFGNTMTGWVFSLDLETGEENWALKKANTAPVDTGYVEAHDGVVVTGLDTYPGGGAGRVLGIDAKDGLTLWEYRTTERLWNIMPLFPGDDSFIVMDIKGGVSKHGLKNGTLLWSSPVAQPSFSDGGVMVAPDGKSYTCSNHDGTGQPGMSGELRAFAATGELLWEKVLKYPCNSWPVITPDLKSVVVPIGAFVGSPAAGDFGLLYKFRRTPEQMHDYSLSLGEEELATYGMPKRNAAIEAYDTENGNLRWSTELPVYGRLASAGDEEGFLERKRLGHRDQCLPAQFGAPTVSGDGTIYVGRADGKLYAVESGNGKFQTFDAKAGFLHPGTSWAPGMMAVATCDGLFVWNY